MLTIDDKRAQKAAKALAKSLGVPVAEAIAVACETALAARPARGAKLDAALAAAWREHPLPRDLRKRRRLANHNSLYGADGLPK
jgi:hypothetical protein